MPEGVEVSIFVKELANKVLGCKLNSLSILGGKYSRKATIKGCSEFKKALPLKIIEVKNKGKFSWVVFEKGWTMWVTYGLSGRFKFQCEDHCHIKFNATCPNGEQIVFYFKDMRNFGNICFCKCVADLRAKLSTLGPDPLKTKITGKMLKQMIDKMKNDPEIGKVLIDKQNFIAGVGNYLRADILYWSGISPYRKVKSLTMDDLNRLAKETNRIFKKSYKHQLKNGLHSYPFDVYFQETDPYGNKVISEKQGAGGRTIWWVPSVQK